MVGHPSAVVVHVDSVGGLALDASGVNIGGDRSALVELVHDVLLTLNTSVLRDGDDGVVFLGEAAHGRIVGAVLAGIHRCALHVLGLVLLASHIRNATVLVRPGVCSMRVSPIARACRPTIDEGLNGRNNVLLLTVAHALHAVSNGRISSMSPALNNIFYDDDGDGDGDDDDDNYDEELY